MFSEKEAWEFLAVACDNATLEPTEPVVAVLGNGRYGLCSSISDLHNKARQIDVEVYKRMIGKIRPLAKNFSFSGETVVSPTYVWPLTMDGAAQRAAFCREQAAKLQGEMDG